MKKDVLKHIRDNTPEPLKLALRRLFRNRLIRNPQFIATYQTLVERGNVPASKVKELQIDNLKNILRWAYDNVPYYTDLFESVSFDPNAFYNPDQLATLPFLTKDIIRSNFDRLIS